MIYWWRISLEQGRLRIALGDGNLNTPFVLYARKLPSVDHGFSRPNWLAVSIMKCTTDGGMIASVLYWHGSTAKELGYPKR